jgi:hypothetical protein
MSEPLLRSRVFTETQRYIESYEHAVAGGHRSKPRVWSTLLSLLECPHPEVVRGVRSICTPPQAARHAADIRYGLVQLLFTIGIAPASKPDACAILGGIHRAKCWRDLIATEDGAYLLAASLVGFLDTYSPQFDIHVAVAPAVSAILNEWMAPDIAWFLPSPEIVCEKLFGAAWTQFSLPDDCRELSGGVTKVHVLSRDVILLLRPPFLQGLGVVQAAIESHPLPELVCSP